MYMYIDIKHEIIVHLSPTLGKLTSSLGHQYRGILTTGPVGRAEQEVITLSHGRLSPNHREGKGE